jgi:hypothetical protein
MAYWSASMSARTDSRSRSTVWKAPGRLLPRGRWDESVDDLVQISFVIAFVDAPTGGRTNSFALFFGNERWGSKLVIH